jgi:hypothetical protein
MAASISEPSGGCTASHKQDCCPTNSSKTFEQTRLPTKQIGTWPLEARHTANKIHIGCGRLWGEIRWRGTCPASQTHARGTLQTHLQLDRNTIHWDHIGLGLQQTTSAFINTKLREEVLATIPSHRWQTTAFTLSKRTNSIWRQEAICNRGIDGTFVRRQGQMLHSTSMRKVLIPGQSSRQHPSLPNQCLSIPIIETDHRYDATNTSTP